ncbi:MAG: DUF5916 domain-containing protein [Bacteroidota bacterium]
MKFFTLCLLCISSIIYGSSRDSEAIKKLAARAARTSSMVTIDGELSEPVWQRQDNCFSNLIQRDPTEGAQPTERTEIRIAYDDEALYVGARMYDSRPDSIIARLGRRDDNVSSDMIYFFIDSYLDRRTGNYFGINAAGTLFDGTLYNDEWDDNSWDGVWEGSARIDDKGWTAEIKIPYSQLRFHKADQYVWGVDFKRIIQRKNESDYIVFTPKNGSGFVSRFPELDGIENIVPPGRIELVPYTIGKAEYLNHDENDPFNKGSKYTPGIGADLKVGFGSNLTLNATINPDFGQVEVDPAVVNLSDVETFYQEKRPFFVEGSSIFEFGFGGARNYWGFNWPGPNLFYSRRIGRSPQGSLPDNDYENVPAGAHILGAAKLTGKVWNNWNIGAVSALTMREHAEIQYEGKRSELEVEPLSYYGVFRMQRDFNEGRQGLGFITTYTNRFFKEQRLREDINSNAGVFGLDGWSFIDDDKAWVLTGWAAASRVTGSRERITELQRNSQHYFQRPDAAHLGVDSSATSLSGYAGRFYINKQKGNFFFNSAFGFLSPGFDVNDAGYNSRSDVINMHIGGGYKWTETSSFYRYLELGGALFRSYDFGKNVIWEGIFHFGTWNFLNYYSANWNLAYNPQTISNRGTRGGPLSLNPSGYQINLGLTSDSRKSWVFSNYYNYYGSSDGGDDWSIEFGAEWRPGANISVSLTPSFAHSLSITQWVDKFSDPAATATFGSRYVFARMDQTTVSAAIRLNWTFTPQLSLQLYMQPLISAGNYQGFKELARPGTMDYNVYGAYGASTIKKDGTEYTVDPDGAANPAGAFTFDDPSFNFKSLRGNAVLRWEYHPGSILYLVWTQSRSESEDDGNFNFGRSFNRLMNTRADNIFMVKFTYWFNM